MRRRIVLFLAGYSAFVAFVVLSPSSELPSTVVRLLASLLDLGGAPAQVTVPYRLEFVLNALMVVPITAAGSLLARASTWRDWAAWAFVVSGGVELVQAVLLPGRSASFVDVCANTAGGLLGGLLGALLVSWSPHGRVAAGDDAAQSAP